jgi:hypothetical protein
VRDGISVYDWYGNGTSISNSTISGNGSDGISTFTYEGWVSVSHSTVVDNGRRGVSGGGYGWTGVGSSIIARNATENCGDDVGGGGNFDDDGSCPDSVPITGLASSLADNGGPTQTHALSPGSSAIDATGDCSLTADQRGLPRNDDACDGGAYEFQCTIVLGKTAIDTRIYFSPTTSEFDVVTGFLSDLLADSGFLLATCLGSFPQSPAIDLLPDPPPGDGRYYLARGLTSCVGAGYGDSNLPVDPRDALDPGPCP